MPRARLGVALLVPEPVATEIDGLRRALGDGALGRIPAHLTLVPPVNVALDRIGEATDVLLTAASAHAPIDLGLGPVVTFWPTTPVLYLEVGGDVAGVRSLRDAVFRDPLARSLTYDFVPHVTLADEVPSDARITAAVAALADYRREVRFERVHLLREGPGRIWTPIADAALAAPVVVGRGGMPLTLVRSSSADVAALARVGRPEPVVVSARRDGAVVGVAEAVVSAGGARGAGGTSGVGAGGTSGVGADGSAEADRSTGWLVELTVAESERGTGVGSALLAELGSALASAGVARLFARDEGPTGGLAGFLRHRGFTDTGGGSLVRDL